MTWLLENSMSCSTKIMQQKMFDSTATIPKLRLVNNKLSGSWIHADKYSAHKTLRGCEKREWWAKTEKSGRLLWRKCYFEVSLDCRMGFDKCKGDGWDSLGERTTRAKALKQAGTGSDQDTRRLDQRAVHREPEEVSGQQSLQIGFFSSSLR